MQTHAPPCAQNGLQTHTVRTPNAPRLQPERTPINQCHYSVFAVVFSVYVAENRQRALQNACILHAFFRVLLTCSSSVIIFENSTVLFLLRKNSEQSE